MEDFYRQKGTGTRKKKKQVIFSVFGGQRGIYQVDDLTTTDQEILD